MRRATDPRRAQRLIADVVAAGGRLRPAAGGARSDAPAVAATARAARACVPSEGRLAGALWVFLWVVLAMFPLAIPFIFMHHAAAALHVSNAIAIVMLFGLGYAYGRCTLRNPWAKGIAMVILGIAPRGPHQGVRRMKTIPSLAALSISIFCRCGQVLIGQEVDIKAAPTNVKPIARSKPIIRTAPSK